jgi:hypothetical protein
MFVYLYYAETLAVVTALLIVDEVHGNAGHELRFREGTTVAEVEGGGRVPKPPRGSVRAR